MINVYDSFTDDFGTLGLAALDPIECTIEETAGGEFELTMTHPIDEAMKWTYLQPGNIIKAPCAMRQSPLMGIKDNVPAGTTQTITRQIYRVSTRSSRLNLRSKATTSSKSLGKYKKGTLVIKLDESGDWYQVTIVNGGASGWMHSDYLTFDHNETEQVTGSETVEPISKTTEPAKARDQLFRIYSVEPDTQNNTVTVLASHIFYDLQGLVITKEYSPNNVSAKTALETMLASLSGSHDFTFYCTVTAKISGEYAGVSLVKALLDPDIGIVAQTGARIIRDNYDVFIMPDAEIDRGMEIRHRKNLLSATMTTDASDVVTRIRPVGKDKDGNRLIADWVESPNKGNYPVARDAEVSYDVQVGDGDGQYGTVAQAKAELKRLAQQDFANGADTVSVSLDVDFIALENLEEYADYASMLALFLYDTVRVIASYAGINAKIRVNGYTYDCLLKQYDSIQLGEITDIQSTTYGYEIASGSVAGTRLIPGSVDANTVMRRASIGYAKINQAAVDQLAADAITAVRADIHTIVAQQTTTDELYADLATIATVTITTADIDWASIKNLSADIASIADAAIESATITTAQIKDLSAAVATIADGHINNATIDAANVDRLSAVISEAIHTEAETATFTLAEIKNMVSSALILEQGIADSMMITNLAVTSANLLNATVDKLVLKGSDDKYYHVFVSTNGNITTEEVTPTEAEIAAGETADGRLITVTTANVSELNAQSVKAKQAILGTIVTETLTAGKITATEAVLASAVIPTIYTDTITALGNSLDLSANASITATVEGATEPISDAVSTVQTLAEQVKDTAENAQTAAQAAQETADAATEATANIRTQLIQTKDSVDLIQTTTTDLEGRVSTIESGVHVEGATVEIYTSESPYRNTLTNEGWMISENGTPVITCAETKLSAPRVQISDALIIGVAAWKPGEDKHLRLLKYGR